MAAEQPDFTNSVFGNGLLFDHIAVYLGIPDLKILRQTCKLLYSKVNGSRKFISSLRLTISDETIRENGMCDSITWENVRIVVSRTSSQHFRNIRTDCIADLEVVHHPTSKEWTQRTSDQDSRLAYYELFEVRKIPNLRSMTLDLNLICYDIPVAAMASVVGTVKEFRFQGPGLLEFRPKAEEGRTAVNNLEMLGGLPWKLHSFVIEGLRLSKRISAAIGAIPASSASTLQQLKLCSVKFGRKMHIRGVGFPKLKSIGLEIDGYGEYDYNGTYVAEFLHLQPQLEAIEINWKLSLWNRSCAPSVLEAIRIACSPDLHTLRLRGPAWLYFFPNLKSWEFIRDLTRLRNVTVCGVFDTSYDTVVTEILNCLPSGTQSLELDYVNFDFVAQSATIVALAGFPNLVQLKLRSPEGSTCGILINDAMLQTICHSSVKLRVLHFGSTEITDFGLTGEGDSYNSGISVRNLKGLQVLKIYQCGKITENGILKAIQFPELRHLKLWTLMSKSTVVEIASHNPSLESVAYNVKISRDDAPFTEYIRGVFSSIMAVNPRLTRIHTADLYRPVAGDVPDAVSCRPSYGVSANLADTTTLSHVGNTIKIVRGKASAFKCNCTYYYNMPN